MLVTAHEHDENDDGREQQPSGDHVRAYSQPNHNQKDDAGDQTRVPDPTVKLFEMLDSLGARGEALAVFFSWIHF